MSAIASCSICEVGALTEAGDCRNPECVCSARLLYGDEVVRGRYEVEGPFTERTLDGTFRGQLRTEKVDSAWMDQVLAFAEGL